MTFTADYMKEVAEIAKIIDIKKIESMIDVLVEVRRLKGRLFVLGVGGSAGNASHAVNDFRKLTQIETYAPTDNISELTARTNDEGFETIFKGYLEVSKLESKDCLLILSVGGGDPRRGVSKNLCLAIDYARSLSAKVLGIVGREGGCTYQFADECLVIPEVNSGLITPHSESFQAVVWHLMVSHPKLKHNATKW